MITVIRIEERELPIALVDSDEFQDLDELGKREFAFRLRYIEEIPVKLNRCVGPAGVMDDIKGFIDRIELDLMINLGAHGNEHRGVSTWLLHSSWTFETSAKRMLDLLPDDAVECLNRHTPGMNSSLRDFEAWVARSGSLLIELLDGFYGSRSFDEVMAYLVAIDLSLAQMYSVFIAQRLNPQVIEAAD